MKNNAGKNTLLLDFFAFLAVFHHYINPIFCDEQSPSLFQIAPPSDLREDRCCNLDISVE